MYKIPAYLPVPNSNILRLMWRAYHDNLVLISGNALPISIKCIFVKNIYDDIPLP